MACNLPKIHQKVLQAHLLLSQLHVLALACSCKTLYTLHVSGKHHVAPCPVLKGDPWGRCARGHATACCSETSSRPAAGKVGPGASPLGIAPSTLQPTKAKTKQGRSEMTQPSSSSALRSTPIPHQDFQGTQVPSYSLPGSGTSHQSAPRAPGHYWHSLLAAY